MISEPTSCKRRDPHLNKAGEEMNCIYYLKWHINSVISKHIAKSLEKRIKLSKKFQGGKSNLNLR